MTQHEALLHRVAAGNSSAVAQCMDAYGGLVWSIAKRMLGATPEAEDAVQEVFIEIWRKAARFDASKGSEVTFIATVARRRIIDRLRRLKRQPEIEPLPETLPSQQESSGESVASLADDAQQAQSALAQLSDNQQRVIQLAVLQGMTHTEVSESMGMPLGTVKTHVRRGLMRLREMLDPEA
jgi:RNA polymerase sigma-70 factor (ECF subfamily)